MSFYDDDTDITPPLPVPRRRETGDPDEVLPDTVKADSLTLDVTEEDLNAVDISNLEKKLVKHELDCIDMYLHNYHRSFACASSISSVIQLAEASLKMHKHRREMLREISNLQTANTDNEDSLPVVDAMGRPIKN